MNNNHIHHYDNKKNLHFLEFKKQKNPDSIHYQGFDNYILK